MRVGIMSMQRVRNYGSYLQAYGLKKIIEELGHQVVFVDYKVETAVEELGSVKGSKFGKTFRKVYNKIKIGKNKCFRILRGKQKEGFAGFIAEFEKKYIRTLGVSRERQYRTEVDVLVIGSDEVFNCTQDSRVGYSKELFGANNHARKVISYAASFGNTNIQKLEKYGIKEEIGSLLKKFSALSVRDKNSYDIVNRLSGRKPEMHLDPVLIYNYENEIEDIVTEKDYIVVYAYNNRMTMEEGNAIKQFAKVKRKKLIALGGEQSFCDEYVYCEPLKMLSYFKHADYVITDTFHGTIFAVINHKPFVTIMRKDEQAKGYGNQEKLSHLLETLNLNERCIKDLQQLGKILDKQIDFAEVDRIREKELIHTITYLKEQIENI